KAEVAARRRRSVVQHDRGSPAEGGRRDEGRRIGAERAEGRFSALARAARAEVAAGGRTAVRAAGGAAAGRRRRGRRQRRDGRRPRGSVRARARQAREPVRDAAARRAAAGRSADRSARREAERARAQANQALDRLREAQQRLERNQGGRGDRDLQRAQRQAEELANEQKEVASDVNSLDQAQAGPGRDAKAKTLGERKEAMDAKVADLQQQLERLANQMRRDEEEAARKLDEAAGSIRDKRIREKIRYTQRVIQQGGQQSARGMEDDIGANLDALQKKIGDAASAVGRQSKQDSL